MSSISKKLQRNYTYDISAEFVIKKDVYQLDIKNLYIDNNYERNFTPLSYIYATIPLSTYDLMVSNRNDGRIILSVEIKNVDTGIKKLYFRKSFLYNFPAINMKEINKEVTKAGKKGENDDDSKRSYIGLIDLDSVNRNRMIINGLFINTNVASITHQYLKQKIIREPFDNNPNLDFFFVPPIEGIPSLLKYLNSRSSFYNTGYRYFDGYKCAYLLSNKGTPIQSKDGSFSTYNINIVSEEADPTASANIDGFIEDLDKKVYTIQVVDKLIDFAEDNVQDNIFNQIYAIDYQGNSKKIDLNVHHIDESKTKPKIVRVFDNNLNYANTLASGIEINADTVIVSQYSLNNAILDPSKEFILTFIDKYKDKNGRYLLTRKIESYDGSTCTTIMYFKKVKDYKTR